MTRLTRRRFVAAAAALAGGALLNFDAEREISREVMGSTGHVTALHPDPGAAGRAAEAAMDELHRLDRLLSPFREGSEVRRLNEERELEDPSREVVELLRRAKRFSEGTGGVFDLTPPSPSTDSGNVVVTDGGIELRRGAKVDIGGIGVGYGVDRAAEVLREQGVDGLVSVGGEVAAAGGRGSQPWRVGVRDPREGRDRLAAVELEDAALATSGNYVEPHVLDPSTGEPAEGPLSVTVVAETSTAADALSTAAYVAGPRSGTELVEECGASCIVLTRGGEILRSGDAFV